MRKVAYGAAALLLAMAVVVFSAEDRFIDPLDLPTTMLKHRLTTTQMTAVTRAGDRLVAVGIRGLLLVSDDGGKQWSQVPLPVSSDLLDVQFPTAKEGWVVGHDGVVLHTRDAGNIWEKQLDGRIAKKLLTEHFEALVKGGNTEAQRHLKDTQINYEGGADQALLGVWFRDPLNGFVCGSFGTLLATHDGGATWESWVENVESSMPLHFYAIRGTKQGIMLASEKGIVFRLDQNEKRFQAMQTGYTGTFFSLLEAGDTVFALGLRGTAYRLKNASGASWEKIDTGVTTTISASTLMPDGEALLVTMTGQMASSRDSGEHFKSIPVKQPMAFAGVAAAGPANVVVVGGAGVRTIPLR